MGLAAAGAGGPRPAARARGAMVKWCRARPRCLATITTVVRPTSTMIFSCAARMGNRGRGQRGQEGGRAQRAASSGAQSAQAHGEVRVAYHLAPRPTFPSASGISVRWE